MTIKNERMVYGDGTVTSVEGNCVKVAWDSDPRIMWSLADDIEVLPATRTPSAETTRVLVEALEAMRAGDMDASGTALIYEDLSAVLDQADAALSLYRSNSHDQ